MNSEVLIILYIKLIFLHEGNLSELKKLSQYHIKWIILMVFQRQRQAETRLT